VAPDIFVSELGRLKIKEPSSMAVCLMTGIITDCAIVSEGFTGPENKKTVHKVSIAPFRQDFRLRFFQTSVCLFFYFHASSFAVLTFHVQLHLLRKILKNPVLAL
jgi:hypothetical protein